MPQKALNLFARGGTLVCAIASLVISHDALGGVEERLGRLASLEDAVVNAEGPSAITALRNVWQEWDQGDPSEVEASLRRLSVNARLTPPVRVYASLLSAYARRRRGDYENATLAIQRLGYVSRWLTVGPFDNEGKAGFDRTYEPEKELLQALSLSKSYEGKERPVRWRATPNVFSFGWVDAGTMVRPVENTCSLFTTFVRDTTPKARERTISLWTGAAGAFRMYWNGAEVLRDPKYRDFDSDRFGVRVPLQRGSNRLTVKVCGDESAPLFSLRLANADGAPDETLEANPDANLAAEASKGTGKTALPKPEGPIAEFEKRISSGNARHLEAFARYLRLTQSDDPAEHLARELARKSVEKEPSVSRYLLLGELAEDRNQRSRWVEAAETRVATRGASTEDRIHVLLARANLARGGVNWRDAIPYYDKVLRIDPDNVTALLARFELYSEAGLKETAASVLLSALERRPKSVALLRALAALRAEQERTTEAEELSARYSAFRADDPSLLRGRLELALAKRNAHDVAFYVDRLLAANPDSQPSLVTGARAYVSMGDRTQAIALFKRALELAPEDVDALRGLADLEGLAGNADEQIALLKRVLEIKPQDKDVRDYLAHTGPATPRPDEAYSHPASEFLSFRDAPDGGRARRTLVNLQVTRVFPNGLSSRFHQIVFQPLTSSAAEEAREYAFGFEADSESVQLRGARVYRKNGQIDEAVQSGEGPADNPSLATYTSARAFYVRFPRLFPGDVVELLYRVEDISPRNAFADYFGEIVYLQSGEPVKRAEYVLISPTSRTFYFNTPTLPGLTRKEEVKGDSRTYSFAAKDVAPLDPEAHQPPYSETLARVHVSTYKNWDEMGRWYWGLVKDQFVADDEVRRRALEATKGLATEREKVRAVYDYVVQKTRYVALEFGIHGFKPYRCAQIFARGFGDCKDKATLIVTMLKELGIPATIVIVRTGMKGDFDAAPASLAPFDHAIAYVPSQDLYLDGTAEYTGSTELPAMDRGALALQVNEGKPVLVHLPNPPAEASAVKTLVEGSLSAEGALSFDWSAEVSGVSASSWRQRYHAEATRTQRLQEDLSEKFPGAQMSTVSAGDLENIEIPALLRAKGKAPSFARNDADTWSLPVGPAPYLVKDYAPLERRKQAARFSARSTSDTTWNVKLPAGAKALSVPVAREESSPFGSVKVTVESSATAIRVRTVIVFSATRVSPSEYSAFREYCERADRVLGQRFVYAGGKS